MVSAAFYLYVGYLAWRFVHGWWRGVLIVGLVILVLLIGLSRLYLQVHYLSDVVAGYLGTGVREILGFGLVVLVLLARPWGLFGQPAVRRV